MSDGKRKSINIRISDGSPEAFSDANDGLLLRSENGFGITWTQPLQQNESVSPKYSLFWDEKKTCVTLTRTDDTKMELIFRVGEVTHGHLFTPYGEIPMEIKTDSIVFPDISAAWVCDSCDTFAQENQKKVLSLRYELHISGDEPATHAISLEFFS